MQFALCCPPAPSPILASRQTEELTLVERPLPDDLIDSIAALMARPCNDLCALIPTAQLKPALDAAAAPPALGALAVDIAVLARSYANETGAAQVEVRLERIEDDACRTFHRDAVRSRLLTTYRGPGTQYVADAGAETAIQRQARFCGPIHEVPTGALAWMRGSAAGPGRGLVHRSPPIRRKGVSRLLLALTEMTAAGRESWTPAMGPILTAQSLFGASASYAVL